MVPPIGPAPSARRCYYCGFDRVHRWGTFSGRQRYRCVRCHRTFSTFTGTPLHYLKCIDRWDAFCKDMEEVRTIRFTAKRLGLHKDTVFRWRHRFLSAAAAIPPETLRGIVALGDARFRYNQKGRPRARSLSGEGGRRGEWLGRSHPAPVWVLIVLNGKRGQRQALTGPRRSSANDIVRVLRDHVADNTVLVGGSGPFSSVSVAARRLDVAYRKPVPGRTDIGSAGYVPLYVYRLRRWLVRFRGVATRYLTRYMLWFHDLETGPGLPQWSLLISIKGADRP